jgi:hypothetical protein
MHELIEKYFNGETNLDEERTLKNYFNGSNVAPEFEKYRSLFVFLKNEKTVEMPAQKSVILKAISGGKKSVLRRYYSIAVAAAMIGAFAVGAFLYQQNMQFEKARIAQEKLHKDTFEDPEKAMQEIKAALALVSRKMNKGQKNAAKGLQKVENLHIFNKNRKN